MSTRWIEIVLALAALTFLGPQAARAQGQNPYLPAPIFQNEGRDPIAFNTALTSYTLTIIISSDTIARSTLFQSISSNTATICISPSSGSFACNSSWPGVQLPPNSTLTDFNRSAWYGRVPAGNATQNVNGYRTRDRGDYGAVGAPGH